MRKLTLFYIFFVFFLPLTGCYADRKQLENSTLQVEGQQQGEKNRITLSYKTIYESIKDRELEKAIALLQKTLKDGKEVNLMQRDDRGRSLLHFAIVDANSSQEVLCLEIVSLLINLDQDVNARDNEANTPLHIAASKGLFFVAERLVENGANIYAENKYSVIPLHCAAEGGNVEVVRLLIDQNKILERTMVPLIPIGLDNYIDKKNTYGRTPLYLAMDELSSGVDNLVFNNSEKYIFIVKLLVASGANVHIEDKFSGKTLLHIAAGGGCVEMVRMLLEKKVKVDPYDRDGNSPLAMAVYCRGSSARATDCLTIVNILIEAGANVYHKNKHDRNLLHRAVAKGNVEIVKLLIGHKIEINSEDKRGCTPLHLAAVNIPSSNTEILEQQCYLDVVDLLIQGGARIDSENNEGYTPLQLAIEGSFDKMAIHLIRQGASINPPNGHTLLHIAINAAQLGRRDAYIALIRYLVKSGIIVNGVDAMGNTPLHLAVKKLYIPGFQEVVKSLIEGRAIIDIENKKGETPLRLAIMNRFDEIATHLIKQGVNINLTNDPTLLHAVIKAAYVDRKDAYISLIRHLLNLGIIVNGVDSNGNTPLHLAAEKLYIPGFQEVVNLLIELGADLKTLNNKGMAPLFYMRGYIREVFL